MTALLLMMRHYFHIRYWSSNQEHGGMIARPCMRQRYRCTERGTSAERIRGETANYGSGIEKHRVHRTLRRINEQRLAAVDRGARISRDYTRLYKCVRNGRASGERGAGSRDVRDSLPRARVRGRLRVSRSRSERTDSPPLDCHDQPR